MEVRGSVFVSKTDLLLIFIAVLLLLVLWEVGKISRRLKERFPTEKEQDFEWAKRDPMGYWEAHKEEQRKR